MWQTWHVSPKTDLQFVSSIHELVVSTSRNVILVIGGAYLLWQSAATASYPETFNWKMAPIALTAVLTFALAWRLLTERFLVAQVVWQVGLAATGVLTTLSLQGGWNALLWPQILITEEAKMLLMPAIARQNRLIGVDPYALPVVWAAALAGSLLPLALYAYSQRNFISAMSGAVKA